MNRLSKNSLLRDERGQLLIIFALMMPVLLGLVGLAMDFSMLLSHRRHLQAVADLTALAGVQDLPAAPIARASAIDYAGRNGFISGVGGRTVTVTTPFDGKADHMQVVISYNAPTSFMRVIGIDSRLLSASAVAARPAATYAIYAGPATTGCPNGPEETGELRISGGGVDIVGDVHANGDMKITGGSGTVSGKGTYTCDYTGNMHTTFGRGTQQVPRREPPVEYTYSNFPCTLTVGGTLNLSSPGAWWVGGTPSSGRLVSGVFCAENITVSGNGLNGRVTLVANNSIDVHTHNGNLSAYSRNMLFYAKTGNIFLHTGGGRYSGTLFAPQGEIRLTGSGTAVLNSSLIADRVHITGGGLTVKASPTDRTRLVK